MMLAAFVAVFAGFVCLFLAMDRHHRDLFGRRPARATRWRLRLSGIALLGLSCAAAMRAEYSTIGVVRWIGELSVCALALAFVVPFTHRRP